MATIACPPGYACPAPVQVDISDVLPSGDGWQYLYTPFENQGDPNTDAIAEYMDFEFQCSSQSGLLAAFEQEAPLEFWDAWRQQFVNAGSDMYTAKVYVQPPASYPGTATYRMVVVHSLALDDFLEFMGDLLETIAKSPFLIVFLGIVFFGQTIVQVLQNFCKTVAGDYCHPIGSAFNAYVGILAIGGVFTVLTLIAVNTYSKHEGLGPVVPPAPAGFATPGLHTESGVRLGPLSQTAGISSGGGSSARARLGRPSVSRARRASEAEEEESGLGRRRR